MQFPRAVVILRLIGILALFSIGTALALYLFTRNRRYLTVAWRAFQFALIFALVFGVFYLAERLLLVA